MSVVQLVVALKHMAGKHPQKSHGRGGSGRGYTKSGADYGTHYHGGSRKIDKLDESMLQSRDAGYYGAGFYISSSPEYAKSYGRWATKVDIKPNAKVLELNGALDPKNANPDLLKAVQDSYMAQAYEIAERFDRTERVRANEDYLRDTIATSGLSWKDAVDTFAKRENYDVVRYSEGEVVVKNLESVELSR